MSLICGFDLELVFLCHFCASKLQIYRQIYRNMRYVFVPYLYDIKGSTYFFPLKALRRTVHFIKEFKIFPFLVEVGGVCFSDLIVRAVHTKHNHKLEK